MIENRRNRRKNKINGKPLKSDITKKDKVFGIIAIIAIFLASAIAVVYVAFSKAR